MMIYINNNSIVILTTLLFNLKFVFTKGLIYKLRVNNNDHMNNDIMARVVMNVLENCFPLKLDMVTIAGDLKNFEKWHKHFPPKLLIYRVGLSEWKAFHRHMKLKKVFVLTRNEVSQLHYPSKVFVVFSPTPWELQKLLKRMKKSVTWKSSAIFFFVNEELKSCYEVDDVFREAWKMNIYNAAYVCLDEPGNIEIFSFNPFKNASPETWRLSHFTSSINNNINWTMTLFKFPYNAITMKSPFCPNPEFDKTHDLNNYPVMLRAVQMPTLFELKKGKLANSTTLSDFKGPDSELSQIVWSHLRALPFLTLIDDIGYVDKNNTPTGLIRDSIKNEFDIGPNQRYIDDMWRLQTYPHEVNGICIMMLAKSRQSPPFGVVLFDFHILWRILLLGGVAVLAMVYVVKMSPGMAFLEVLQRLLNMASHFQPEKFAFKRFVYIYVSFTFCFCNLQLNSSITSERYSNMNEKLPQSFKEILTAGYTPMGHARFREFLDENLAKQFVVVDIAAYLDTLFRYQNDSIVCFGDCKVSKNNITDPRVLISKPLFETFVAQLVREDWPLLETVNSVIHRLVQGGITRLLDQLASEDYEKIKRERKMSSRIYEELAQPISLEGVIFIFYFLAAGHLLAFLIFLLEYFYEKLYRRDINSKKLSRSKQLHNLRILR